MRMWFWILLILLLGLLAFIRFAPSDAARWHRGTGKDDLGGKQFPGGYVWREEVTGDGRAELAALDRAAQSEPRTTRLAGSVDEGRITYVTRSRIMGFPDYTTIGVYGAEPAYLEIWGRLRFGRSDLGVNAARVGRWRAAAAE
jgi:hypothetical protein